MAFSDDFNRANGALAGSNGWVAHPTTVGAHSISDNRVVGETTQAVTYNTPAAGSANYRTTVTLVATGSTPSNYYGVLARASASALSGYHARWNSGNVQLYSAVAGALTQLGSNVAQTLAQDVPHDLGLVCDGDQISVEWDGATIIGPITNTAHTSEGVIILRSGANLVRFDDLVVEAIGAGSPPSGTVTIGTADAVLAASGTVAINITGTIGTTLGDATLAASGTVTAAEGSITFEVVNNTDTSLDDVELDVLVTHETDLDDVIALKTGVTVGSGGLTTVTDALFIAGTTYNVFLRRTDTGKLGSIAVEAE